MLVDAPVGLATAMRNSGSPSDRAVVPQRWASWFQWAAPGIPVMVDSRIEVVPPSAWADYLVIAAGGAGTLETLARIRATLVVVNGRDQAALRRILQASDSGWRAIAEDEDGAVFRLAPPARFVSGRAPPAASLAPAEPIPHRATAAWPGESQATVSQELAEDPAGPIGGRVK